MEYKRLERRNGKVGTELIDERGRAVYAFRFESEQGSVGSSYGENDMSVPTSTRPRWGFFFALAAVAVLMRLAPQLAVWITSAGYDMKSVNHAWGFTPIIAIGLYAGAFLKSRWQAVGLMMGTLFLGDLGILALSRDVSQLDPGNYLAYPLFSLLGRPLSEHRSFGRVQTGGFLACGVYFLLTNFLVWAAWRYIYAVELYPPTLDGLKACMIAAIPFAKYFVSTPVFCALLFSPLGVAQVTGEQAARESKLGVNAA